jgi:hypothetical protein
MYFHRNRNLVKILTGKRTVCVNVTLSFPTLVFYIKNTRYQRWNCPEDIYYSIPDRLLLLTMPPIAKLRLDKLWERDASYRLGYQCLKRKLPFDLTMCIMEFL